MTVSSPDTPNRPRPRLPRSRSAQFFIDNVEDFDFQRAAGRLYDAGAGQRCVSFLGPHSFPIWGGLVGCWTYTIARLHILRVHCFYSMT
jgi:hypothetical protein